MNKMDTEQFYREKLLEHYHHPRNVGTVKSPIFHQLSIIIPVETRFRWKANKKWHSHHALRLLGQAAY